MIAVTPLEQLPADQGKDAIRNLMVELTRLLDFAIHSLSSSEGVESAPWTAAQQEIARTIALMVQGIGVSIHSIVKLTASLDMGIRDCFGIARSVCEGSINVAYIIAGGSEVAARAHRHAFQKGYRDAAREWEIGSIRWSNPMPPPTAIPGLVEALAEFTRRNGSEVTDWATHNLLQKQEVISARFPDAQLSISVSASSIYRNASEILHGTFYGVEHFWTAGGERPATRSEFEKMYVQNHLVSIFTAVFGAVGGMLEVIATEYELSELRKSYRAWLGGVMSLLLPKWPYRNGFSETEDVHESDNFPSRNIVLALKIAAVSF